jgi:hypothetical protein
MEDPRRSIRFFKIHQRPSRRRELVVHYEGLSSFCTAIFSTKLLQGTDITEAFETHHISSLPENLLMKFYVRKARTKRHSPFTFDEFGFYRTLKRRVRERYDSLPKLEAERSKRTIEGLAAGMFLFSAAASIFSGWNWPKVVCCLLGGLFMTWTTICAHNFIHQKDNWRMYLFNFNFNRVR